MGYQQSQKHPPEIFYNKKSVLKNFANFTRKRFCKSLFLIKLQAFRHRSFPVKPAKFLRTPILKNVCKSLLLQGVPRWKQLFKVFYEEEISGVSKYSQQKYLQSIFSNVLAVISKTWTQTLDLEPEKPGPLGMAYIPKLLRETSSRRLWVGEISSSMFHPWQSDIFRNPKQIICSLCFYQ